MTAWYGTAADLWEKMGEYGLFRIERSIVDGNAEELDIPN